MKTLLMLGMCLFLVSGCSAQEKTVLLDDFEGPLSGGAQGTVDFGAGNGSSLEVVADTANVKAGTQSLKATFDAVSGGYMYIARGFGLDAKNSAWLLKPEDIQWAAYSRLSFWLYGTGSKQQIAFDVKDSGNEMWRFLVTDDTAGWKQVVCPLKEFFARGDWQPDAADKNANMDFPLKSFQFEPLPAGKGTLCFDAVELSS